jgi:hypothetical protein
MTVLAGFRCDTRRSARVHVPASVMVKELGGKTGRLDMSEKIESGMISRRKAFSLLGLAAALGVAVPPTVLMVSDADAETAGMERRHERREHRRERRHERREHRMERRHERQEGH